tara:strand:- start:217 stop:909 length:693 start_codon:yes stop_codon:yes gene_type:complete
MVDEKIIQSTKENLEWIFTFAPELQKHFIDRREEVKKQFPKLEPKDVRITSFGYYLQHIRTIQLVANSFYQGIDKSSNAQENNDFILSERLFRFSFFLNVFSSFESTIRILMRQMLMEEYYKNPVVPTFIKQKLGVLTFTDSFELARLLRNTVHNNGFYFPDREKGKHVTIDYKQQQFTFEDGKAIEILSWPLTFSLAEDFGYLLKDIFSSEKVVKIDSIVDPLVNYEKL